MTIRRPVRILELRSVWGTGGGPEKTILLGASAADPSRYTVTVCYIRDDRDQVYGIHERAGKLPVEYVELRERHSFDYRLWRQLRELVRARRYDIVHAHEYKTDVLTWLLSHCEPIVPLATAHGWTGHTTRERTFYYPVDRRVLARYPRVIAVSSAIRADLIRAGARAENVDVILNGIDHRRFFRDASRRALARSTLGLTEDTTAIGAVGRLEPQKDFALLIEAFARLAGEFPHTCLLIAGDGSLRGDLEQRARDTGLAERIRLLGHCADVESVYHALDLFVQSSEYEGTPNAVLEAMAFEVPVVATAAGGTAELARDGEHALIVPVRDRTRLETAIRECLVDTESAVRRARAARVRVETALSFDARMRAVERIYDDLMARNASVRPDLEPDGRQQL